MSPRPPAARRALDAAVYLAWIALTLTAVAISENLATAAWAAATVTALAYAFGLRRGAAMTRPPAWFRSFDVRPGPQGKGVLLYHRTCRAPAAEGLVFMPLANLPQLIRWARAHLEQDCVITQAPHVESRYP